MFKKKYKEYKTPWSGYLLLELTHKDGYYQKKPPYHTDKVKDDYKKIFPGIEVNEKESKYFDFKELINPQKPDNLGFFETYLTKRKDKIYNPNKDLVMAENEDIIAADFSWRDPKITKENDVTREYEFKIYPLDFQILDIAYHVKKSGLVKNYDYDIYALYGCRSVKDVRNYYESTKTKNAWNKYLNKEKSRIIWFGCDLDEPVKVLFAKGC
tara:strand:+ start:51 stop:686 length:636 start_codon:yes stop_codon:yes gene_type:complete